ncbi:MAG: hypothetical protein AAFQ82_23300, partial [Myxococcota bacterium]
QNARAQVEEMFEFPWRLRVRSGIALTPEPNRNRYGFGAQLVIPANAAQGWGPGVDILQTQQRRYLAAGLFVEQRLFDAFLMSIGGVGYFPTEDDRPVPFGISSKFGFAPTWGLISPYAGLRIDQVFEEDTLRIFTADAGLTFAFGR